MLTTSNTDTLSIPYPDQFFHDPRRGIIPFISFELATTFATGLLRRSDSNYKGAGVGVGTPNSNGAASDVAFAQVPTLYWRLREQALYGLSS